MGAMAKVKPAYLSFNGGEIGKRALARTDLENYNRCAEIMENCWPSPEGEMSKVPGTVYVASTPAGGGIIRSFEYSVEDNLVMLFTDGAMKLMTVDGFVQVEGAVATLGTWSDESALPSAGGGDAPIIKPPPGAIPPGFIDPDRSYTRIY
jgi:hypothetical protein